MPKAITIGISLTTVCYLLVNVAYITVLGKAGILESDAVAVVSRYGGCVMGPWLLVIIFKDVNTSIFNSVIS